MTFKFNLSYISIWEFILWKHDGSKMEAKKLKLDYLMVGSYIVRNKETPQYLIDEEMKRVLPDRII
jgi:hypothetical protein